MVTGVLMSIDELLDVLLHAPTEAAAEQALRVLDGLSRVGDGPATAGLLQALAQALGLASPAAALNTSPAGEPAGPGGPVASLPPLLQVYAAALHPARFLADVQSLSRLAANAATVPAFAAFQHLVRARSVLQHEALKAFVLCTLAGVLAMWARAGSPSGRLLGVLDRVRDEAAVVPGADADAALHFGRDLLLRLSGPLALQSVIAHELGHNLLDAVWGDRKSTL